MAGSTYDLRAPLQAPSRENVRGWELPILFFDNTELAGAQFHRQRVERERLLDVAPHQFDQLIDLGHGGPQPLERNVPPTRFQFDSYVIVPERWDAVLEAQQILEQDVQSIEIRVKFFRAARCDGVGML